MRKRTLENYCHDKELSVANRVQEKCPLFKTKTERLTETLSHGIGVAEEFRKYKRLGLLPPLDEMTAYEFMCLDTSDSAIEEAQAEIQKEEEKKNKNAPPPPVPKMGGGGETPFKADKMGHKS
jgi:hypothetical protein